MAKKRRGISEKEFVEAVREWYPNALFHSLDEKDFDDVWIRGGRGRFLMKENILAVLLALLGLVSVAAVVGMALNQKPDPHPLYIYVTNPIDKP